MNKRRLFSILSFSSVVLIALTLTVSELGGFASNVFGASHSASCEWSHYERINPTMQKDGIREYWVCCTHHEQVYTKPSVGTIVNRTHPAAFLNDIKSQFPNDPRIISAYHYYYDCEDIISPFSIFDSTVNTNSLSKTNQNHLIQSLELDPTGGVNGTQGIKIQFTPNVDSGVCFTKSFVDEIFSNPEVQAIEFDARGDAASSNFRHRTAGNNVTYHYNITGTGLNTSWQRYSYTRAMYDAECAYATPSFYGVWGTLQGDGYLWIDNIRAVTYDSKALQGTAKYTFEEACYPISTSSTDVFIEDAYLKQKIVKVNTNAANNVNLAELSTSAYTEGSNSLHFHKVADSTFYFYLKQEFCDLGENHGGIKFDILTTSYVGPANFTVYENRTSTSKFGPCAHPANQWVTMTVPWSDIRDTNNGYDGLFGIYGTDGNKEMDIYIDNIRLGDDDDTDQVLNSFENSRVYNFKQIVEGTIQGNYFESGRKYVYNDSENPSTFINLRDYNGSNFYVNSLTGIGDARIDNKHVSKGTESFKLDIVNRNGVFAFYNKTICNNLAAGDKLLFDVYLEGSTTCNFGACGTIGRTSTVAIEPNKWTTVELTKSTDDEQFYRLHEGEMAVGTYWFDNFRIKRISASYKSPMDFEPAGNPQATVTDGILNFSYNNGSEMATHLTTNTDTHFITSATLTSELNNRKGQCLKITKQDGYTAFFLSSAFRNSMGTNDTFSFDLYTTIAINSTTSVHNMTDGSNNIIGNGSYQHPGKSWVTYTFKKPSDTRFLIFQGTNGGDYYFDNFRINRDNNDVYSDKKTFYLDSNEAFSLDVGSSLSGVSDIYLDNIKLSSSEYSISANNLTLNSSLLANGEHNISYRILTGDYSYDNKSFYFGLYRASSKETLNHTLSYGSSGYRTITGHSNVSRIVCNGKSIAFERNNSDIMIPDASLIECLPSSNGSKQNGVVKLFFQEGLKNADTKEIDINITLSGSTVEKTGYTAKTNDTFETFGYSSTAGGTSDASLVDYDHLMEYKRSGLKSSYEQLVNVPVKINADTFADIQYKDRLTASVENAGDVGLGQVLSDHAFVKLCGETSSIYGRDIIIYQNPNNNSDKIIVNFANTAELDAYVYSRVSKYAKYNHIKKLVLCDEPRYNNLDQMAEVYASVRRSLDRLNRQDLSIRVTLLPINAGLEADGLGEWNSKYGDGRFNIFDLGYENYEKQYFTYKHYLQLFLDKTHSPELAYDFYPLSSNGLNSYTYLNIIAASQVARANNVKLAVVSQTYTQNNSTREMSRDDLHFLNNMLMGFGVDEISYFTYYRRRGADDQSNLYGSCVEEIWAMNPESGEPEFTGETRKTSVWYDLQTMQEEMSEFDETILNFAFVKAGIIKSSSISHNQGDAYDWADTFVDVKSSAFSSAFGDATSISINKEYAVASLLQDSNGKYMMMLENTCDPQYSSYQQITVNTSGKTYAVIYENGTRRIVNITGNSLTFYLSSGNAAYVILY